MMAYLVAARPYLGWKLQGLELAAHALEAAILLGAMAVMQVGAATQGGGQRCRFVHPALRKLAGSWPGAVHLYSPSFVLPGLTEAGAKLGRC